MKRIELATVQQPVAVHIIALEAILKEARRLGDKIAAAIDEGARREEAIAMNRTLGCHLAPSLKRLLLEQNQFHIESKK